MERPFPSYKGDEPYIFVSYSHADAGIVFPGITWLRDQGFNIWYDEGISPGASWREELAEAILGCDLFVILVSPRSANSHNCLKEVNFALEHNRQVLAIHQEPTELSPGLQLALSDRQAIFRHELNEEQYREKILAGVRNHLTPAYDINSVAPIPQSRSGKGKGMIAAVISMVVIIGLAMFGYFLMAERSGQSDAEAAAEVPTKQSQPVRSNWIAVLPFNILSGGDEVTALARGLTPQMIRSLQPISYFSIVNHRDVEAFRDRSMSMDVIARELNVRYLVDGSIQRTGDRTRIGIELVDGIRGISVWQETLNFTGNELLDMQDSVAELTTRILSSRLESIEMERLGSVSRESLNADELFLLSSNFWFTPNQQNLERAIVDLREVLSLNPDHAGATSQLAHFLGQSIQTGVAPDPLTTQQEVCELVDRAILLGRGDQQVIQVIYALSDICAETSKAVQLSESIIERNPANAVHWATYSYSLIADGQIQAAREALDKANSLDPDGLWVWYLEEAFRAVCFEREGDWENAAKLARRAVNENPGLFWLQMILANAYGMTGDFEVAQSQWMLVKERFPQVSVDRLYWYHRQANPEERAQQLVKGLRLAGIE